MGSQLGLYSIVWLTSIERCKYLSGRSFTIRLFFLFFSCYFALQRHQVALEVHSSCAFNIIIFLVIRVIKELSESFLSPDLKPFKGLWSWRKNWLTNISEIELKDVYSENNNSGQILPLCRIKNDLILEPSYWTVPQLAKGYQKGSHQRLDRFDNRRNALPKAYPEEISTNREKLLSYKVVSQPIVI